MKRWGGLYYMEKESKKKQLLKIKGYGTDMYQSYRTRFSLITNPDEGRKQVGSFLSCRDHVNDSLRNFVHKKLNSTIYSYGSNPPIDMNKLRLLINKNFESADDREVFRSNIFSAKRLLNFYEKTAGWGQSKITTVNHSEFKYNVWLITGPKEWLSYSNLISMITLLFRIIGQHGPIEFSNNEDVERWFCNLMDKYQGEVRSGIYNLDGDLDNLLPYCWDKFYMIMKHNEEIFTQPIEEAYPVRGEFHGYGGISQLCKFNTLNKTLDANMKKVYDNFIKTKYANFNKDGTAYKLQEGYERVRREERKISENKINEIIIKSKSM